LALNIEVCVFYGAFGVLSHVAKPDTAAVTAAEMNATPGLATIG